MTRASDRWVLIRLFHSLLQESDVEITAMKSDKPTSAISYSLKVVHREKKSDYSVRKWRDAQSVA